MGDATVVAFFNNKGGVGKTSLVYHLAWMYAELGRRVLAADLDPQANLTAAFLDADQVERLWSVRGQHAPTVHGMLTPLIEGTGDVAPSAGQQITPDITLLPGDLNLSAFEDELSQAWPRCLEGRANPRAFRVMSAISRIVQSVAAMHGAELILLDVGPNLGAINRAALVASDHVVVPLAADLFSVQGLRNLGPALRDWRVGWEARLRMAPTSVPGLPGGAMHPLGYVLLQHGMRAGRPVKAHERWMAQVPGVYRRDVLGAEGPAATTIADDTACLGAVRNYHSLIPLAQEARKPVFALGGAERVFGSHAQTVSESFAEFSSLAVTIARRFAGAPEIAVA